MLLFHVHIFPYSAVYFILHYVPSSNNNNKKNSKYIFTKCTFRQLTNETTKQVGDLNFENLLNKTKE